MILHFLVFALYQFVDEVIDVGEHVRGLSNLVGVSKGKGVASKCNCVVPDRGNIKVAMSNYVVADKAKYVVIDAECVIEVKEANESEMIGERVSSLHEAFEVPMSTLFLGVLREDVIS